MVKSASETRVEDVLSSVRRLVSEERPRNERRAVNTGPGALVLTDDQRIESNASVRIAGRTLEERIAELEVAVADTANDDEFEPDGSEDQALHRPDRIVYTRPPQSDESDEMRRNTLRLSEIALIDTGADEEADVADDVPLQFRRDGASLVSEPQDDEEAPMAEDVKETLTSAEVRIFSSPDDEIDRITARLNGDPYEEKTLDSGLNALLYEDSDEVETVETPPSEETPHAPEALITPAPSSKKDKWHKVVDAMRDEPGPEEEEHGAAISTQLEDSEAKFEAELDQAVAASMRADDTADTPEVPSKADVATDVTEDDEGGDAEAETALAQEAIGAAVVDILDEDDLRPIVSRMIRDELQGELGERITRNVRKLVRREILRALAARDAE